jgi:hypothetical protein
VPYQATLSEIAIFLFENKKLAGLNQNKLNRRYTDKLYAGHKCLKEGQIVLFF